MVSFLTGLISDLKFPSFDNFKSEYSLFKFVLSRRMIFYLDKIVFFYFFKIVINPFRDEKIKAQTEQIEK